MIGKPSCPACGTSEYEYRPSDNDRDRLYCEQNHPFPTAEPMTVATALPEVPDDERRTATEREETPADLQEFAESESDLAPVLATVTGTWPDGEPAIVREAEDFERRLIRIVQRIERDHGPMASRVIFRVLNAVMDEPPKLSEDEAADLLRLVGRGEWGAADARLDERGE
ncbi:hypothetical protein [Actinomadura sp. 9N215]|uniref:hypothetical protein n=1 Tax=Actinomadura sp. 9N215 TaxID=3375150 RepID=UPI00379F4F28